jgi:hypothetical protein
VILSRRGTEPPTAALELTDSGHTNNPNFRPWQSLYLSAGIITVLTAPIVWWKLESDISTAKFWSDDYERLQAVERLRANQTGTGSHVFQWSQVREMFMDPKSWLFAALICIPNIGELRLSSRGDQHAHGQVPTSPTLSGLL